MEYLVLYGAVMCLLVLLREWRQTATLDKFLVAERKVGGITGSMSIAASWIWAPAIFVSTRVGYEWGYSGLLWFILPNMLALVIFAPLAAKVRSRLPQGYSYVGSVREAGGGFWHAQLAVQLLMQVVIFAIQLTAGAELLSAVTGADYRWLVVGMGLTPFCYTFFSGLRTSVFTDAIQYAVIAIVAGSIVCAFPGGLAHPDSREFAPLQPKLLVEFGVSSAISLLVAIFADHQQWQRAFAVRQRALVPTYWMGALMHGLVTLSLGTFGGLIFASGYKFSGKLELVGIEFIKGNYHGAFVVMFVVMALCALISTLDSGLCAFSSLCLTERGGEKPSVRTGRKLMFGLAVSGIAVSVLHLPLLTLWFLAGTIRLAAFVPTVASIFRPELAGRAGTASILSGLIVGGSVFGIGIYLSNPMLRTTGMALSLVASLVTWYLLVQLRIPWQEEPSETRCQLPCGANRRS